MECAPRAPRYPKVYLDNVAAINRPLARLGFPAGRPNALLTADVDQFIARGDWLLDPKHTLTARYSFYDADNRNDRAGVPGVADDPLTSLVGRHLRLRDQGLVSNFTSTLSPRLNNNDCQAHAPLLTFNAPRAVFYLIGQNRILIKRMRRIEADLIRFDL